MKRWLITFALLLPLAELYVAMIILSGPAVLTYVNLQNLARGKNVAQKDLTNTVLVARGVRR